MDLQVGQEYEGEVCRWFGYVAKPYGFVRIAGCSKDLFVPHSRVLHVGQLRPGERVRVEVRMDRQGRLFGDNCELIDDEPRG